MDLNLSDALIIKRLNCFLTMWSKYSITKDHLLSPYSSVTTWLRTSVTSVVIRNNNEDEFMPIENIATNTINDKFKGRNAESQSVQKPARYHLFEVKKTDRLSLLSKQERPQDDNSATESAPVEREKAEASTTTENIAGLQLGLTHDVRSDAREKDKESSLQGRVNKIRTGVDQDGYVGIDKHLRKLVILLDGEKGNIILFENVAVSVFGILCKTIGCLDNNDTALPLLVEINESLIRIYQNRITQLTDIPINDDLNHKMYLICQVDKVVKKMEEAITYDRSLSLVFLQNIKDLIKHMAQLRDQLSVIIRDSERKVLTMINRGIEANSLGLATINTFTEKPAIVKMLYNSPQLSACPIAAKSNSDIERVKREIDLLKNCRMVKGASTTLIACEVPMQNLYCDIGFLLVTDEVEIQSIFIKDSYTRLIGDDGRKCYWNEKIHQYCAIDKDNQVTDNQVAYLKTDNDKEHNANICNEIEDLVHYHKSNKNLPYNEVVVDYKFESVVGIVASNKRYQASLKGIRDIEEDLFHVRDIFMENLDKRLPVFIYDAETSCLFCLSS